MQHLPSVGRQQLRAQVVVDQAEINARLVDKTLVAARTNQANVMSPPGKRDGQRRRHRLKIPARTQARDSDPHINPQ